MPAPFIESFPLKEFDLFLNTASLGEMRNKTIEYWYNVIQNKLAIRFYYTLNRFLNSIELPAHAWRLLENKCSVLLDSRWVIDKWELEPDFARNPYVHSQISREVEIFATRVDKKPNQSGVEQLLESRKKQIELQDWFRFDNVDPTMTLRDTMLSHDFTKNGTLYTLWDSIRLSDDKISWPYIFMLKYLRYINKSATCFYEEFFYYLSKLEGMEHIKDFP